MGIAEAGATRTISSLEMASLMCFHGPPNSLRVNGSVARRDGSLWVDAVILLRQIPGHPAGERTRRNSRREIPIAELEIHAGDAQ